MKIPGLPEGVDMVRFGLPGADDYWMENAPGADIGAVPIIKKGPLEGGGVIRVIVVPEDKFEFIYDILSRCFQVVPKMDAPITITANHKFTVTNEVHKRIVEANLELLKDLPGYVVE